MLVNNAGIGTLGPTQGFDEATFDSIFGTNLKVPFYLVGEIALAMARTGKGLHHQRVDDGSRDGGAGHGRLRASKAALNLLTQSWAAEYGPSGVRVNAVSPGTVRTPSVEVLGEVLDQIGAQSPATWPSPRRSPP